MIENAGRLLMLAGVILVILGGVVLLAGKVPWLGRLPGDIVIKREGFTFYFPVVTCILLSAILSVIIYFISRK